MKKLSNSNLGVNPFSASLVIIVNIVTTPEYESDGEDMLPVKRKLEKDEFCKFYCSSERRVKINSLTLRGKELLLWILFELKYGQDWIWINKERFMKESGISAVNTFKGALKDLIRNGVLATTIETDTYWINPFYFFKGNRVNKFKQNVIEYGEV